jgi:4-amino-4-deoxychorismate lyase
MCRFIETIQLFHGELKNMEFHQERFERTRREKLGLRKHPKLLEMIRIPAGLERSRIKCRVTYGNEIELIEYESYGKQKIRSLKLVCSDHIDYTYKYADRSQLRQLFEQREDCDDILVVRKNCITDSYVANVLFWDGREWLTPDTPLLQGTMRASLLQKGIIRETSVTPADLPGYHKIKLINALNDLEHAPEIPAECIH